MKSAPEKPFSHEILSELNEQEILYVKEKSPQVINIYINNSSLITNLAKGEIHMNNNDHRTITNSFNNSSLNGNTNIQADNNKSEFNGSIEVSQINSALSELSKEIEKIEDEDEKFQAESNFQSLEKSIDAQDTESSGKILRLLAKSLGHVASIATIAAALGVPSPF